MGTVALDLDRVLFNTNAYVEEIKNRMRAAGIDPEEAFSRARSGKRVDISRLYEILSQKGDADSILLKDIDRFVPEEIRTLVKKLKEHHDLVVISVGDGLQPRKIEVLGISKLVLVESDEQKVEIAEAIDPLVFVDDKRKVVEAMRARGIKAYQALWFLDESYRRDALEDALENPLDLLKVLGL